MAREMTFMRAAEGYTKLTDHVLNIKQRVDGMGVEHLPSNLRSDAKKSLSALKHLVDKRSANLAALISENKIQDELDESLLCISPSDFGFHNAIRTASGVRFIDFEFAGWDDPAKTLADFALQPRIPIGPILFPLFCEMVGGHASRRRCIVLASILQLKWASIILGVLDPWRSERLNAVDKSLISEEAVRERIDQSLTCMSKENPFGIC
jgi:hypothetical protein